MTDDASEAAEYRRIELVWPHKNLEVVPTQALDGVWTLVPQEDTRRIHSFIDVQSHGEPDALSGSVAVSGNRIEALRVLARTYRRQVSFSYLDLPRIEVDDKLTAFRGESTYVYSTWLTVLSAHLRAIEPLMRREGVVAIHVGDVEESYARLVADEILGRDNRVGTIVWQRSYAPRNMKGMTEFTATHDCILLYGLDRDFLAPVGVREAPAGFSNDDQDPRGPWKAMHKGAHSRRAKSDFNTYIAPYRWEVVEGRLPDGLWRLSPLTGVLWGTPVEQGSFPITVEVSDASGSTSRSSFTIQINATGQPPDPPAIPWLFDEIDPHGPLIISTESLPEGVLGSEYRAICLAQGGTPFRGEPKRPGSGRYWEFSDDTLVAAYQRDQVDLGKTGNAIPRIKAYLEDTGDEVVKNQQTWWPARHRDKAIFAGFTQDATKHLKKLREIGVIKEVVTTAKPEPLLARLMSIFTRAGDTVLEPFGESAALSAVALKTQRRFIYLSGESERGQELLAGCAVPRLLAVIEGRDQGLEDVPGEISVRPDSYLPYAGGGSFTTMRLGPWVLARSRNDEFPTLNTPAYQSSEDMATAVLTAEGFFPVDDEVVSGIAPDGTGAVVIPPDEFLTTQRAAEVASVLAHRFEQSLILYFMAGDDFDPSLRPEGVSYRRVPSEVAVE